MKYLPLRTFDTITNALNFSTSDCHVLGGCDVYTTKAAGSDKKLYKSIEQSLESQYASILSFSAGLASQQAQAAAAPTLNLARASPFGSLSQVSSRRTFAYLIATLNASHPDYDFSHLLRPSDFRRERSFKKVMTTIDTTLNNLRPTSYSMYGAQNDAYVRWSPERDVPSSTSPKDTSADDTTLLGEPWSPRMWHLIDSEMALKECTIYSYTPAADKDSNDLFSSGSGRGGGGTNAVGDEGEEGSSLWSFNYFFFNKLRKRVCYLYLRGVSNIETASVVTGVTSGGCGAKTPLSSSAATTRPLTPASGVFPESRSKRGASGTWLLSPSNAAAAVGSGALDLENTGKKRARYWLGDRADEAELVVGRGGNDEGDDDVILVAATTAAAARRRQDLEMDEDDTAAADEAKAAATEADEAEEDEHSRFMNLSSTEEPEDRRAEDEVADHVETGDGEVETPRPPPKNVDKTRRQTRRSESPSKGPKTRRERREPRRGVKGRGG